MLFDDAWILGAVGAFTGIECAAYVVGRDVGVRRELGCYVFSPVFDPGQA